MSSFTPQSLAESIRQEEARHLHANWLRILILGIALVVMGCVAISSALVATLAVVWVFGIFMLIGGVIFLAGSVFARGYGGFFLAVLAGILHLAAGFVMVVHPLEAAIVYTLLIGVFLFVEGAFRIASALSSRYRHWGYVLFSGVITALLGVLIWAGWPASGLWVIGTFIGVNMVLSGAGYIGLALHAKGLNV